MSLSANSHSRDSPEAQNVAGRRRSSSVKGMFTSFFGLQHESDAVKNKIKEGIIPARRASTPGSTYQELSSDAPSVGPSQQLANYAPDYNEGFREEEDFQIDNSGVSVESTPDTRCEGSIQSELDSFLENIGDVEDDPNVGMLSSRRFLSYYLSERGFILPKLLLSTNDLKMFSVTCGKMVFLPTVSTTDEEYLNNLDRSRNNSGFRDSELNSQEVPSDLEDVPETLQSESSIGSLDTDCSSPIEPARALTAGVDDENNTSYNIAVVLLVNKPMQLSPISALLCSHVSVHWCNGLPADRPMYEEHYTNGELKWTLYKDNYNLYVPRNIGPMEQVIQREDISIPPKVFRVKSSDKTEYDKTKNYRKQWLLNKISNKKFIFEPGYYVFVLPIRFSHLAPETIYVPSGRLSYSFYCGLRCTPVPEKAVPQPSDTTAESKPSQDNPHPPKLAGKLLKAVKAHLHIASPLDSAQSSIKKDVLFGSAPITVVRTPPQRSISTADKPIYINRIWADSLSYEISLAQKYVPLGTSVPLKIKLVPLVKNISVKRLRVNIIERITFKSKDLKYDFDQVDVITEGAYNPFFPDIQPKRRPTRSLPLLEVRARKKGIRAVKEVVIENSPSENILCYSVLQDQINGKSSELLDALTIETHITFPKYPILTSQSYKWIPPYGIDEFVSTPESQHRFVTQNVMGLIYGRRPSSSSGSAPVHTGSITSSSSPKTSKSNQTNFVSNSNIPVLYHCKRNRAKRGLYMDSNTLSNINVKHKLEIMLRISKKDSKDASKTKHYEVLIDTPIIIVSEHCNYQNLELPTYDMATKERSPIRPTLPTFDEVTSVPTSAQTSPRTSPLTSPIGSPNVQASYDPDDLSIQQLSLSRATSHTQNADSPNLPEFRVSRRYSNIDEIFRPESASWLQAGSSVDQPCNSRSPKHSPRSSEDSTVRNADGPPNYNTIYL